MMIDIRVFWVAVKMQLLFLLYSEQDYEAAIKLYTDAINLDPFNVQYYGNRSFAYIKTECFGYGLADANKALELDRTYVKVCSSNVVYVWHVLLLVEIIIAKIFFACFSTIVCVLFIICNCAWLSNLIFS
jgi:tetratricopeptide (TPR) repeat protein